MTKREISQAAAAMGRRGYRARLARHGIEAIQATARENGRRGGRPRKDAAERRGSK